jgi:hypothetical protein
MQYPCQAVAAKPIGKIKGLLIGAVIGCFAGIFLARNRSTLNFPYLLVSMALALYTQIIFHEFGHYIFGKLAGFRLYSFRVSCFAIEYVNGKYKWKYHKNIGYGGLCMMIPTKAQMPRHATILYFSGGIIANLFCCLVGFSLLFITDPQSFAAHLLYATIFFSLFMAIGNAIPFTTKGNFQSDGNHILNAVKNNTTYKLQNELFHLNALSMSGVRPSELPGDCWNHPEDIESPVTKIVFLLYGYYHYLDKQEFDRAFACITKMEAYIDAYPKALQYDIKAEIMFAHGYLRSDKDKVTELHMAIAPNLEKDVSVNGYRIKAMYAFLVNEDHTSATEYINKSYAVADSFIVKGFIPMERTLLSSLSNRIASVIAGAQS